ncbi:histidine--tRNA ligase [Pueribacillus sp. YX66]|uniref:histidine--tRNA ligase n=1 Tax=Pueribacillus sp. YX66 TaxID=3229242 RepID=UPI00358CE79F
MGIQIPRGTQDILPGEIEKWQYVEQKARQLCESYCYEEIRTPIFEATELFVRGVGETTDIVQKEMYTFKDRGNRSITLRPEGTAPTVRSFVEKKLYGLPEQPTKLYYIGPMFRYERPQTGRMRQFYQFGVEALGSNDPAIDAEVIALAIDFYKSLGLKELTLVINSLGDTESRTKHKQALIEHFKPHIDQFCDDCQIRLEKNPLRILDCKKDAENPLIQEAPAILNYLNAESSAYFNKVKQYLKEMKIDFVVDPTLVRGLDYYNHTAFEIMSNAKGFGAITTLSGGGRYNGLVQEIGGPETAGIGFALSIERLLMALDAEGVALPIDKEIDCYLIAHGEQAHEKATVLLYELRKAGFKADQDYLNRKIKGQFKSADRKKAKFTAILGESELENNTIAIKEMLSGEQTEIPMKEIIAFFQSKLT